MKTERHIVNGCRIGVRAECECIAVRYRDNPDYFMSCGQHQNVKNLSEGKELLEWRERLLKAAAAEVAKYDSEEHSRIMNAAFKEETPPDDPSPAGFGE